MNHCSKSSMLISSILGLIFVIVGLFAELKQVDMCEFLENSHTCILWLYIVLTTILLVLVLYQLYKHNGSLNLLNEQVAKIKHTSNFTYDIKNIERYVRIIAYIALVFCLGAVIHYLAIGLPRVVISNEEYKVYDLGVDYLGLIVAIFAVIITLLVGWQIFSSIKEKEELNKLKDTFKEKYGERIKSLDKKVYELSLRSNRAISTLSIGTYFEILNFTIMANNGDFKINDNEQLRLKHLQRDILNILRGLDASNEIADCNTLDFKFYAKVSKEVKEPWLITYVRKFFVFGDDNQKIALEQKDELFDKA